MCLLVFSVIGVINAAACFAGSAIYGHENEVYNSMMSFCNVND